MAHLKRAMVWAALIEPVMLALLWIFPTKSISFFPTMTHVPAFAVVWCGWPSVSSTDHGPVATAFYFALLLVLGWITWTIFLFTCFRIAQMVEAQRPKRA